MIIPSTHLQFKSRMFEGKEFSFYLRQNQMGKYLEIRENYVDGSRPGGTTSFIFVADRDGNQETLQVGVNKSCVPFVIFIQEYRREIFSVE